jgi:hypothetical protein
MKFVVDSIERRLIHWEPLVGQGSHYDSCFVGPPGSFATQEQE